PDHAREHTQHHHRGQHHHGSTPLLAPAAAVFLARGTTACPGHRYRLSADADSRTPCREQRARQPSGSICTTIRRPQCAQNRGGSSPSATARETGSSCPGTTRVPVNGLQRSSISPTLLIRPC